MITIEELCELIESAFNIPNKLNKDSNLVNDANLSSVDFAVLMIRLEHQTGREVDVTKLAAVQTIGDLYDILK